MSRLGLWHHRAKLFIQFCLAVVAVTVLVLLWARPPAQQRRLWYHTVASHDVQPGQLVGAADWQVRLGFVTGNVERYPAPSFRNRDGYVRYAVKRGQPLPSLQPTPCDPASPLRHVAVPVKPEALAFCSPGCWVKLVAPPPTGSAPSPPTPPTSWRVAAVLGTPEKRPALLLELRATDPCPQPLSGDAAFTPVLVPPPTGAVSATP